MAMMIEAMRVEFSRFLSDEPFGQHTIDDALRHVVTLTYERALQDAQRLTNATCCNDQPTNGLGGSDGSQAAGGTCCACQRLVRDLLDPEMFGLAVTQEVRRAAKAALQSAK
jgi:hypothetical protein